MADQRQTHSDINKSTTRKPVQSNEAIPAQDMDVQDSVSPESAYANILFTPRKSINPATILALQQTVGNQAVQRLLANRIQQQSDYNRKHRTVIQTRLTVSQTDDVYEQESDRVAEVVARDIASHAQRQEEEEEEPLQAKALLIQRQAVEEKELQGRLKRQPDEEEDELQTKLQRRAKGNVPTLDFQMESRINAAKGNGQPLPDNIRESMERSFNADFSGVRVHTDTQSDELSQSLEARAFTTGQDIFFHSGNYNPGTSSGNELIAHELTHTIQQTGAKTSTIQRLGDKKRKQLEEWAENKRDRTEEWFKKKRRGDDAYRKLNIEDEISDWLNNAKTAVTVDGLLAQLKAKRLQNKALEQLKNRLNRWHGIWLAKNSAEDWADGMVAKFNKWVKADKKRQEYFDKDTDPDIKKWKDFAKAKINEIAHTNSDGKNEVKKVKKELDTSYDQIKKLKKIEFAVKRNVGSQQEALGQLTDPLKSGEKWRSENMKVLGPLEQKSGPRGDWKQLVEGIAGEGTALAEIGGGNTVGGIEDWSYWSEYRKQGGKVKQDTEGDVEETGIAGGAFNILGGICSIPVAAVNFYKGIKNYRTKDTKWQGIGQILGGISNIAGGAGQIVSGTIGTVGSALKSKPWKAVLGPIGSLVTGLADGFSAFVNGAKLFVNIIGQIKGEKDLVSLGGIFEVVKSAFSSAAGFAQTVLSFIQSATGVLQGIPIVGSVLKVVTSGMSLIESIWKAIKAGYRLVKQKILKKKLEAAQSRAEEGEGLGTRKGRFEHLLKRTKKQVKTGGWKLAGAVWDGCADLVKLAGACIKLGGEIGSVASGGISAAVGTVVGMVTDITSAVMKGLTRFGGFIYSGVKWVKQKWVDKQKAKGETMEAKSSAEKHDQRVKVVKGILDDAAKLGIGIESLTLDAQKRAQHDPETVKNEASALEAEYKDVELELEATGVDPKDVYKATPNVGKQAKLIYKALKEGE